MLTLIDISFITSQKKMFLSITEVSFEFERVRTLNIRWISPKFCLTPQLNGEWDALGTGVLVCTVTQIKLCFFYDTSLACSKKKKKPHYCSCGTLFMKYLSSHSPNLCFKHSVFVWRIIHVSVHLGQMLLLLCFPWIKPSRQIKSSLIPLTDWCNCAFRSTCCW